MSMTMKRKRNPAWIIGAVIFSIAAGLFIAAAAGIAFLSKSSRDTSIVQPSTGTEGSKSKRYTRDEFQTLIVGKTPEQVIAAVGRPDSTDETPWITWFYLDRVLNPATNKYSRASVHFRDGIVDRVTY